MNRVYGILLAGVWLMNPLPSGVWGEETSLNSEIAKIQSVEGLGAGHAEALLAVRQLQQQDAAALMPILQALETANPLAANWLRNAFETIAARTEAQGAKLPVAQLLEFLEDRSKRPRSRRLAFEWIRRVDPEQASKLVPGFLNDPSDELRREAVARLLEQAEKLARQEKTSPDRQQVLQQALTGASDDDQVRKIVEGLKDFEIEVDLPLHYGLITTWQLIGPFDNKEEAGFDVVYPPEQGIDLTAEYEGQLGEVSWQELSTEDSYGKVDLAKLIGPHKGAIQYATTTFVSDTEQPVEFRLSTPNAWKLWVNGELLFEREEYHRGTFFDQYRIPGKLKAGENQILLKICQNEQEQNWAQVWQFQFRVCNPYGMAVHPSPVAP